MFISDFAIRRPVITVVSMVALVVFGLVSLVLLQTDEFPDVAVPVVVVRYRICDAANSWLPAIASGVTHGKFPEAMPVVGMPSKLPPEPPALERTMFGKPPLG